MSVSSTRKSGNQDNACELLSTIYFFQGDDGKSENFVHQAGHLNILYLCSLICTEKKIFVFLFYTKGIQLFDHVTLEKVLSCYLK